MSKIKSKSVRATISNPDVLSMFQNVLAGDGAPPLVAIWPKFVALRDSTSRFVRVLEVLAAARALRSAADQPRVAAFAAASRAEFAAAFDPPVPDLAPLIDTSPAAALDPRASFATVPADVAAAFAAAFPVARDSQLVKRALVTCANLTPHKRSLADSADLRSRFLDQAGGTSFVPVHGCADLDFRRLWAAATPGPFADADAIAAAKSDRELLLLAMHQLYKSSHAVYEAYSMPDLDVEEFSQVVMDSIKEVRGKIPRCNAAFDKIVDSVGLLRGNFSSYYRDYVGSNNPTIIMENFVLDVSKNADASPEVARQFRTIISHYKKIAAQSSTNPQLQSLFKLVDRNFKELERTTGGPAPEDDPAGADASPAGAAAAGPATGVPAGSPAGGEPAAGVSGGEPAGPAQAGLPHYPDAESAAAAIAAAEEADEAADDAAAEAAEAALGGDAASKAEKSEAARARARRKKARHARNVATRLASIVGDLSGELAALDSELAAGAPEGAPDDAGAPEGAAEGAPGDAEGGAGDD